MTKRELTSMFVKLMGIYYILQIVPASLTTIRLLPAFLGADEIWMKLLGLGGSVILPAIWIVFFFLVISKSDKIAARLHPTDSDISQLSGLGFEDVQILGYNFIGLLLIVISFPELITLLTKIKFQPVSLITPAGVKKEALPLAVIFPNLFSFLTNFVVGLILFLKPKGLANLWKKSQVMKYEKVKPDNK